MAPPSPERRLGRVVPVSETLDQLVGLGRSPGAGLVWMDGCGLVEDRVDDAPGLLDGILAREQRGIAGRGVAEQALVRLHVVAGLVVPRDQLDVVGPAVRPAGRLDA